MNRLSKEAFQTAIDWLNTNARPLENALSKYYFQDGDISSVLLELKKFQNEDGGFGHGLEPDFHLPKSSPLATTIAFQHLIHFTEHPMAMEMIKKGIGYFENTFLSDRKGWLAVPPEVNDFPHAIWWHVNEDGKSAIDSHWGNPSAEIIGYLARFPAYVKTLNIEVLVSYALDHLLSLQSFQSEHEIYCYIRFFELNHHLLTTTYKEKLKDAVSSLVDFDQESWENYVPYPLKFISNASSNFYGISNEPIQNNLSYLVEKIKATGYLAPNWAWPDYPDTWEKAKQDWIGVLTLNALLQLDSFSYINK